MKLSKENLNGCHSKLSTLLQAGFRNLITKQILKMRSIVQNDKTAVTLNSVQDLIKAKTRDSE